MSVYSVFSAMVFYNLGLIAVYILMRKTRFVINNTAASLSLLTLLATIRLFIPADLACAFIIRSTKVIPSLRNFISYPVFGELATVGAILATVWVLGTLYYLGRDLYLVYKARQAEDSFNIVKRADVLRTAEELGLRCRIVVSPDICEPYSAGILKPTIYLPDWDYTEAELKIVLGHEYAHISSFDAFKKLVFLLLEALFWWNPISHIFRREFDQLLEIQCDHKLTRHKDEKTRLQYAETLFSVIKRVNGERKDCLYSCALTNSKEKMKQRFELILDSGEKKIRYSKALLYIAMLSVFALSFFVIAQPFYEPPMSTIDGVYFVDGDNSFVLKDGDQYTLFCNGQRVASVCEDELSYQVTKALPIYDITENMEFGEESK